MIHVHFDPRELIGPNKDWWDDWKRRAEGAINAAIADMEANQTHSFRSEIWRELKEWLLQNVFQKKCAYCESVITATSFGDAEHYRPKGKVTVKGRDIEGHPGYYWLAYHWKNLVPACQRCNSDHGKLTQFPVAKRHVRTHLEGLDPDSLDKLEEPLILHPYNDNPDDDPRNHIQFGLRGIAAARKGSQRGKETVKTCNLNRGDLLELRQEAQQAGCRYFWSLVIGSRSAAIAKYKESLQTGSKPYSAAVLDFITLKLSEVDSTWESNQTRT
jgi:hypothetical protein